MSPSHSSQTVFGYYRQTDKDGILKNLNIHDHFFHGCTVHVGNIKSFICPINAHTNYSKIVELLKTFKITLAPTCFGLHKPSSGNSQSLLRQSYNIDFSVYMSLM